MYMLSNGGKIILYKVSLGDAMNAYHPGMTLWRYDEDRQKIHGAGPWFEEVL